MEIPDILEELRENLRNFRSIDQLLKISCVIRCDSCEKAIETNISMAIQLKRCLESIEPLHKVLQKTISESFEAPRQFLSAPIFKNMLETLNNVLQPQQESIGSEAFFSSLHRQIKLQRNDRFLA